PPLPRIKRRRRRACDTDIAPQRQHRDRDLLAGIEISLVDLVVGIGAGTVVLAHRMHPGGIAEWREVMFQRARIDGVKRLALGLTRYLPLEEELSIARD